MTPTRLVTLLAIAGGAHASVSNQPTTQRQNQRAINLVPPGRTKTSADVFKPSARLLRSGGCFAVLAVTHFTILPAKQPSPSPEAIILTRYTLALPLMLPLTCLQALNASRLRDIVTSAAANHHGRSLQGSPVTAVPGWIVAQVPGSMTLSNPDTPDVKLYLPWSTDARAGTYQGTTPGGASVSYSSFSWVGEDDDGENQCASRKLTAALIYATVPTNTDGSPAANGVRTHTVVVIDCNSDLGYRFQFRDAASRFEMFALFVDW